MKANVKIKRIFIILGIALLFVILLVFIRGKEDDWICVNGGWISHGLPDSAMPNKKCVNSKKADDKEINNFEECAASGNAIMESYPRQCRANEKNFVENIGNELEKKDLILITNPRPNQGISNPLVITGQARGYWFFEASFPVELYDQDGKLIGSTVAQAKPTNSDGWMTENFVPFEANLNIAYSSSTTGTLVLKKDNPSGLSEKDDRLIVPVKLTK